MKKFDLTKMKDYTAKDRGDDDTKSMDTIDDTVTYMTADDDERSLDDVDIESGENNSTNEDAIDPKKIPQRCRLDEQQFYSTGTSTGLTQQVQEIDDCIDEILGVKSKYKGNIIKPYKPNRLWLWTRWHGTILQHAWKDACLNMLVAIGFVVAIRVFSNATWDIGLVPDPTNVVIQYLSGLSKLWAYLMSLTTFILTFFLNQAYGLWRILYSAGRKIQGRTNDYSMLMASLAEREKVTNKDFASSTYSKRSKDFLEEVAAYVRLFHALSWASLSKKYKVVLTPLGLSRMVRRGVMSREVYDQICSIDPSMCNPHSAVLMWMMRRAMDAIEEGILPNNDAIRRTLMDKLCILRGVQAGINDELDGRIPLAYAHFVQLLVDSFLFLSPFALYGNLGVWSVPAVGLLTLFYSGLLDLSKILLDPLDNDAKFYGKSSVNMDIGVLIREGNSGSNRWKAGLATMQK